MAKEDKDWMPDPWLKSKLEGMIVRTPFQAAPPNLNQATTEQMAAYRVLSSNLNMNSNLRGGLQTATMTMAAATMVTEGFKQLGKADEFAAQARSYVEYLRLAEESYESRLQAEVQLDRRDVESALEFSKTLVERVATPNRSESDVRSLEIFLIHAINLIDGSARRYE